MKRLAAVLAILFAAGAVYLTLVRNPRPVAVNAPAGDFSAQNAMLHLEAIARSPRPWQENAEARNYILNALSRAGLHPEVQTYSSIISRNKPVINVAVRIPGAQSSGAVVLTAHYDTMPLSPGAGDDGSGTVILMELARAIAGGPSLRNDVIVVLTDAEEFGLIGAIAFAGNHRWMKDVRLAINLEGVTEGPLVMWRMGAAKGWSVRELGKSAARIALAPYFFSGSPMGDSDFTAFSLKDLPAYDLLTIYSYPTNHAEDDLPEGINPASVQKAGDALVQFVRHLGGITFPNPLPAMQDRVYFNLFNLIVSYPAGWVPYLSAGALLFTLAAAVGGLWRQRTSWKGILAGFLSGAAMLAGIPILVTIVWRILEIQSLRLALESIPSTMSSLFHPHDWPHSPGDAWQFLAYLAATALTAGGGVWLASRRVRPEALSVGALLLWSVVMMASAILLPAGNYIFAWPALLNAVPLMLLAFPSKRAWVIPAAGFAVFATFVLVLPVLYNFYLATGLGTLTLTSLLITLIVFMIGPYFCSSAAEPAGRQASP